MRLSAQRAAAFLSAANRSETARRREARLRRLLADPDGAALVFRLADRVLRPVDATTAANQLAKLTKGYLPGVSRADAALLRAGGLAARLAPVPVTALVRARLRYETQSLILPAGGPGLSRHLARMRRARQLPNLNLLGEAVLGNEEAASRASAVGALLSRPDVDCVSVKASAISAGLSLVDFDGSVKRICAALVPIFRQAASAGGKLVNLDMEEQRDLPVTVAAFIRALGTPGLQNLAAGIAIQAYLPASHAALDEILSYSQQRVGAGGAPVRVRLVKGANLAMERAGAELAGWPQPVYPQKVQTDASYKALLERLLRAAARGTVQVGAASHNLFDIAFALVLAEKLRARVEIEMLAGMAEAQAATIAQEEGRLLVYAPAVRKPDFRNALAYLARRLDENTTPEGFLRHIFELNPGNEAWHQQERLFADAVTSRHTVRTTAFNTQARGQVPNPGSTGPESTGPESTGPESTGSATTGGRLFFNEPTTDLTLPSNRQWVAETLARAGRPRRGAAAPAPLGEAEVDAALRTAVGAADNWEGLGAAERCRLVAGAAPVMAQGRADAIAVMAGEAGKVFDEADAETNEAIDYARWYGVGPGSLTHLLGELDLPVTSRPLGAVVIAPPWNFPYAIPAGGTLAALVAGNTVLVKPAPETPTTARVLVEQLHRAGIPQHVLQFLPVADGPVGEHLVGHASLGGVVLTGSYQTAEMFSRWAPTRRVLAETSGKNAIVVTANSDVDQAVRDVVTSAFGHAGQKCSAASLAIVAAPIYDRSPFLRQLADAVRSLRVGPAWSPATQVGPIVGPFTPALERALLHLEPGESWLVEPEKIGDQCWRPGVRTGVRPGSWSHATEWFGPVLAVMRAENLGQALQWQNDVEFGLTAGLSSLDPDEHRYWAERVQAGNLYINRSTTGAVVGRQPFGGWKKSAYGPTAKAGGPNYLLALRRWQDDPSALPSTGQAEASYRKWWQGVFSRSTDLAGLRSESNVLRYRRYEPGVVLRAGEGTDEGQLRRACVLSSLTATPLTISSAKPVSKATIVSNAAPGAEGGALAVRVESDEAFASGLARNVARTGARLRILGNAAPEVYGTAAGAGISVLDEPICSCGRIELVRWLREQVVTRSLHRYGNLVYSPEQMAP